MLRDDYQEIARRIAKFATADSLNAITSMKDYQCAQVNLNTSPKIGSLYHLDLGASKIKCCGVPAEEYYIDQAKQMFAHVQGVKTETARAIRFANQALKHGYDGCLLANMCDAQGHDYSSIWKDGGVTVMQYCRTMRQRQQVSLWRLDGYHDINSIKGINISDKYEFEEKIPMAIWRGNISGTYVDVDSQMHWFEGIGNNLSNNRLARWARLEGRRLKQLALRFPRYKYITSLAKSKYVDVGFSRKLTKQKNIDAWVISELFGANGSAIVKEHMKPKEQLKYRYLICVPGNDCDSSLYWSLNSNSLVLRCPCEWESSLDWGLLPWIHYIPISGTPENLEETIDYFERNYSHARQIIANAKEYMSINLSEQIWSAAEKMILSEHRKVSIQQRL